MTRNQLISELLAQVREATDDAELIRQIEFRLHVMPGLQLRDIYSRNAAAVALTPRSRLLLLGSFSSSPAALASRELPVQVGHPAQSEGSSVGPLRGKDSRRRA